MKHIQLSILTSLLALALFTGCQSTAAKAPVDTSKVSVVFVEPEKFTDLKDGLVGTDKGREHYQQVLETAIKEAAAPRIPAGATLEVRITDIDLAGDFLPSARSGNDIRVIKTIYAPRANLSFTLKDAAGNILQKGDRRLINMSFMNDIGINRSDELFHDTKLLRDWVSDEFRK